MGGIHTRQKKAPFHGARGRTRWIAVKGFSSCHPPFQDLAWRNVILIWKTDSSFNMSLH